MSLQNLQAEMAELILSDDDHCSANLDIYRQHIMAVLTQALLTIYPRSHCLLGADFFQVAAKEYLKRYPSRSGNLNEYGEYFADFLAEYPPLENNLFFPEIARLEWVCHNLQFAPDHPALEMALMRSYKPDQYQHLHFILHPASQLVQFNYPVLEILDLSEHELDEALEIARKPINLLIIRRDLDIALTPLTPAEHVFLTVLHEGDALSAALVAAMAVEPNFNLEEKLPKWVKDKTLVDCYVSA